MGRTKWVLGSLAALFGFAGVSAYLHPTQLLLMVARLGRPRVEANHTVTWQQGPESPAEAPGTRPPNVLIILADDMGYNGLSLHGGMADGAVKTPCIDSIAEEGVEFVNGYAGDATCAPSRASILTGRYATRFGFEFTPVPRIHARLISLIGMGKDADERHPVILDHNALENIPPLDDEAIPKDETTIAGVMQRQGYHTIHLGKWHLGGRAGSRPEDKGFDESLGFMPGASLYLPEGDVNAVNAKVEFDPMEKLLWAGASWSVQYNGSPPFAPTKYMTDYLADEAIAAIHANRNRPFLMYFAPNAVHTPLQATRDDYDALSGIPNHTERVYGAMIRNLDRNVGRLLQALKRDGLDRNTLVIFTSDNGGPHSIGLANLNRPYRGWKATFFEGGLHVPFFMRWPERIPPALRYAHPVAHVDIAATAAAAASTMLPSERINDGVDLLPYLQGQNAGEPHESLFWRSGALRVVLKGSWKLQQAEHPHKRWLYDLASDPTEQRNLAADAPEKLRELGALMNSIDHQQAAPLWPSAISVAIPIDHPLGVPAKSGEEYVYWYN